ncbi:MAG: hypothetical protein MRY83_07410 [Flavobacteriales bacterium]|nr:hypothetical protein [Flavobacteriales bacterium]
MEKENLANRSGYLILMLALMFFLGLVLNSCVKDNLDFDKLAKTQWNPELAIPLVTAHLSMDDIIKQADTDILSVGADNFITLVYQDQLISVSAKDAIQIPVQSFNYAFQSDTTIPLVPNGTTLTLPADTNQVVFDMGPNNQVDSVFYNSGTFSIQFSSTFQQDLTINLVIPNARLNGVPFSQTINLTYTGSTPTTSNVTFNIDDYLIDLSNGGTTFNTMEVVYTVTITGTGNGVSNTDAITIDGSFSNLDFQAMYGYIDVSSLSSSPDTVDMALFDAASGFGQFTLVNPSVHIIMSSSIGVETNASFNILQGINTNAGTSLDL